MRHGEAVWYFFSRTRIFLPVLVWLIKRVFCIECGFAAFARDFTALLTIASRTKVAAKFLALTIPFFKSHRGYDRRVTDARWSPSWKTASSNSSRSRWPATNWRTVACELEYLTISKKVKKETANKSHNFWLLFVLSQKVKKETANKNQNWLLFAVSFFTFCDKANKRQKCLYFLWKGR